MELSKNYMNDILKIIENKTSGEIEIYITSLKSNKCPEEKKKDVVNELNAKLGLEKGNSIGKLIGFKIDAGFDYKDNHTESNGSVTAVWIANTGLLRIRWGCNQRGKEFTVLHLAVMKQYIEMVECILMTNQWLETLQSDYSPVTIAQFNKYKEIISLLEKCLKKNIEKEIPEISTKTESNTFEESIKNF